MKSILIYSGKGGVGKTTTTYCLYRAFKAKRKKVLVLDMDLNTPSMHYLMKKDLISPDAHSLFMNKSIIDMFLRKAIREITKVQPDILLIDTPPSVTDVHQILIKKLTISCAILVSQPTELSRNDVERTVPFFEKKGITVLGIIENMVEDKGLKYNYTKLLSVKKSKGLDSKRVYKDNKDEFAQLVSKLISLNIEEVSQRNKIRTLFNENISWQDVKGMYGIIEDEDGEIYLSGRKKKQKISDIRFVNLSTWEKLHQLYKELEQDFQGMTGIYRRDCITEATYKRIERLINVFKKSDTGLFMIVNSPNTTVPTICGEIGECSLKIDDKFNGIPTVEYKTNKGSVRLFPHEVTPAKQWMIDDGLASGAEYIEEGNRLIPSISQATAYAWQFGSGVGMPCGETYEETIALVTKLILKIQDTYIRNPIR